MTGICQDAKAVCGMNDRDITDAAEAIWSLHGTLNLTRDCTVADILWLLEENDENKHGLLTHEEKEAILAKYKWLSNLEM